MATPASDIDVSPMIFTEFVSQGKRLPQLIEPLVFNLRATSKKRKAWVSICSRGNINIMHWGATRDEAWDVLIDDFDWKWRHIAEADPEELAPFYAT